jgi:hypothetical protein
VYDLGIFQLTYQYPFGGSGFNFEQGDMQKAIGEILQLVV